MKRLLRGPGLPISRRGGTSSRARARKSACSSSQAAPSRRGAALIRRLRFPRELGGCRARAISCTPPGVNRDPPSNAGGDLWPGVCAILEQLRLCAADLGIKSKQRVRWPISDARTDLRKSKAHPSDPGPARESSNCSPEVKCAYRDCLANTASHLVASGCFCTSGTCSASSIGPSHG